VKTKCSGDVPVAEANQRPSPGIRTQADRLATLQGRSIRAGYGTADILHGVDFTLHAGEVLGVVGPNGSGKSTLLRALTGLLPLRDGEVILGGSSLASLGALERARRCAVQPQVETPLFDYTVGQFVLLGRHPHRAPLAVATAADRDAAARAMEQTDLTGFEARSIRSLSTGEWQRTLLARALAQEAPILLLDEPAAHLDPGHRYAMHELLRRLAREQQRAVLCVSHDLNLAAEFCDRLMFLAGGTVRALGTPAETMTDAVLQDVFHCPALRVAPNPFTGRPGTVFVP
jgi:iron complex transport system ATP-binding protein